MKLAKVGVGLNKEDEWERDKSGVSYFENLKKLLKKFEICVNSLNLLLSMVILTLISTYDGIFLLFKCQILVRVFE